MTQQYVGQSEWSWTILWVTLVTLYLLHHSLLSSPIRRMTTTEEEKIHYEYVTNMKGEQFHELMPNPIYLCAYLFLDSEKCMKHPNNCCCQRKETWLSFQESYLIPNHVIILLLYGILARKILFPLILNQKKKKTQQHQCYKSLCTLAYCTETSAKGLIIAIWLTVERKGKKELIIYLKKTRKSLGIRQSPFARFILQVSKLPCLPTGHMHFMVTITRLLW